jgi:hypothetical protein
MTKRIKGYAIRRKHRGPDGGVRNARTWTLKIILPGGKVLWEPTRLRTKREAQDALRRRHSERRYLGTEDRVVGLGEKTWRGAECEP